MFRVFYQYQTRSNHMRMVPVPAKIGRRRTRRVTPGPIIKCIKCEQGYEHPFHDNGKPTDQTLQWLTPTAAAALIARTATQ